MKTVEKMEEKIPMEKGFKKFGGELIPDLGEYVRSYLKKFPGTKVYVGADASERGRNTLYASVVAFYDEFRRDGVHYIFNKELVPSERLWVEKTGDKNRDKALVKAAKESSIYGKIWGEVERVLYLGNYLEKELDGLVKRLNMEELQTLGYSSHQNKLIGLDVDINIDPGFKIPEDLQGKVLIKGRQYFIDEKNDRLINVTNPTNTLSLNDISESELEYVMNVQLTQPAKLRSYLASMTNKDVKNKSSYVYEGAKAALEGQGFRVRYKPHSWAANCAADFVCDKQKKSRRAGKYKKNKNKKAA
jgi:predicted RNase H-related nuclease YkuK (DUF458 family)